MNIPEKELWAAVLRCAVEDYAYFRTQRYENGADRLRAYDSSKHWLFVSKEKGVGSLSWVCEWLCLDVGCVRKQAKRLRRCS
jgi:hypothetical protein